MQTKRIDGKTLAEKRSKLIEEELATLQGRPPALAVVLVGADPASEIYVAHKEKTCQRLGLHGQVYRLSQDTRFEELQELLQRLNADHTIDGILIQLPLPPHLNRRAVLELIDPFKDVDGLTIQNQGLMAIGDPRFIPCTPKGIMSLLAEISFDPASKVAAVVGRSELVGKPIAQLLQQANASVIQLHSKSKDPQHLAKEAELLIVAAGQRALVDASWVRRGAVVIDVGMHRTPQGLAGDVLASSVEGLASYLTPVPGGVGPLTIISLIENTLLAYKRKLGAPFQS